MINIDELIRLFVNFSTEIRDNKNKIYFLAGALIHV